MRKLSLTLFTVAILVLSVPTLRSQQLRVAEREAEWNEYTLPQTTFVRQTDSSRIVLFRVPSEWKQQQSDRLNFSGPHGATLTVVIEQIPDGISLRDYVSAMMQPLRSLPDGADSMVVRRTTMSALEAREIMFETSAGSDDMSRRIIWCAVNGPNALSVVFMAPLAYVAELEPYYKAIVQSVIFVDKYDYAGFEGARSSAIKDPQPSRVDEVQSLADSLTSLDGSGRQSSITKLASMFLSVPDSAIDLALDSRPMVRSAVVAAIAQSRNNSLDWFLLRALEDRELFVAEQAARAIAAKPNVIDFLRDGSFDWFKIEPIARVWPFLERNNQIKILQEVFAQRLIPVSNRQSTGVETSANKPHVSVRATILPPGASPAAVNQALPPTSDYQRQLQALPFLTDLPASELKLPFVAILAAKNDALTTLALQIAWERNEPLPVAELVKLLASSNNEMRKLAALNLGESGSMADIKSIESYANKPATSVGAHSSVTTEPGLSSNNDLQLVINKIRLREQLSKASGEIRRQLIKKSLADPQLAEWVWSRYLKERLDNESLVPGSKVQPALAAKVLPLGENLFPREVAYYAALPQPAIALDRFASALDGLQLESARSQANLVLMLSAARERLAQQLNSPVGVSPMSYSGINVQEPIAMANWLAEGAPGKIQSAERKAIVIRVTDRARFERSLMLYQQSIGNFGGLTDVFSAGVRLLTAVPAFLPLSAKAILDGTPTPQKETPLLKYSFVGGRDWNGYSIKVVEQRTVSTKGRLTRDAAYLAYVGEAAVLAPDLESLRDVLTRAASGQTTLAANPNFKQVVANSGEAIYLSSLTQLLAGPNSNENSSKQDLVTENGSLKISNSTWENAYRIQFPQNDWLKPFIRFQPEELASPRDLLPRAALAYYFMNFDTVAAWRDWSPELLLPDRRKELASIWAIDFEKEVLPELGPECGVAVLGLPNILGDDWEVPWVAFFKLKSEKLVRAIETGSLFVGSSAAGGLTRVKLKVGDLIVKVKHGFLVLSNKETGMVALEQKEKLIASRDFSRAAKRAPAGLIAFGGYNLEAAASIISDSGADAVKTQISSFISSLANAFHSPNFYAIATSEGVEGRLSLSMDREGRFSVSELASLTKEFGLTYATVAARGVPVQNQERLSSLRLRIRAKAAGEIDRLKEDVSSPYQTVEKISDQELELRVLPRKTDPKTTLTLPIKASEFAAYLQPGKEIRSDDKSVIEKARSIAGEERDAWKVARKLADWTYKNIKWKRVDYATAPQTLATLEADCLEFSQLYVAMARSLGLPARIVSGLAYSGASFGGHAWVEVYVGDWIEVDPTWGTDFVDATHIRDSANAALLTYASLNLVDLEVLEAPRAVAEFQKEVHTLAEKLCQEIPQGDQKTLTSALDLAVLTNETPGFVGWDMLNDSERDLMSSAYRRVLLEISTGFRSELTTAQHFRLLKVNIRGERAEAIVMEPGFQGQLLKLAFVSRNGAWFLTEVLQADSGLHIISETLQPAIKTILERRNNKSARAHGTSPFVRLLFAIEKDSSAAIAFADRVLKDDPKNQGLRHLKALALIQNEKAEDAIQLWQELAAEEKPFAPALLNLARQYDYEEEEAKRKLAIEFYQRYGEREPEDPRAHVALARLYDDSGDDVHAAGEHEAALKLDPSNPAPYVDYAVFLALRRRFEEAAAIIDEGHKHARPTDDDLFGDAMRKLSYTDDKNVMEEFARSQLQRMRRSAVANLYLGYSRLENGQTLQAILLLKKAAALQEHWADPYAALAQGYRNLRNWRAALIAADQAIRINAEYSDGHFHRACALARLGRSREALQSLETAIKLDPDLATTIAEEPDLKVLASNPAFKKLLASEESKQ